MKDKSKSYVVYVTFVVNGEWESFEDIPYETMLDALTRRYVRICIQKEPTAFRLVDVSEEKPLSRKIVNGKAVENQIRKCRAEKFLPAGTPKP